MDDCTTRATDKTVAFEALRYLAEYASNEEVRLNAARALVDYQRDREYRDELRQYNQTLSVAGDAFTKRAGG